MRIAVIGATGMAGSRIAVEAARRGHSVTGMSRSGRGDAQKLPGVMVSIADATDPQLMSRVAAEHDVMVLATRPAIGAEVDVTAPVTTVLDAAENGGRQVLVIGGAGPLLSPDRSDRLVVDDPRFVPRAWRRIALASVDQFHVCLAHRADWTYLSPPAQFEPGPSTGTYRRGGGQLLIDADGVSRISAEDLAIAAVDEIENPESGLRHFTVAY